MRINDCADVGRTGRARHEFENLSLFIARRIADFQFEHEAVNLRFRQRIRAFLLNRILRGQNEKRFFEFESLLANRDLLFLHGLEQRALHLGGGAIDFIGENEVGENRAFARGEAAGLRIINLRADDIGGQHVRRKLQARKFYVQARGQRFDRKGFGETGHTFEQHVAVGQQSDGEPFHKIGLPDNDLAEFVKKRMHKRARFLYRLIDCTNSGVHFLMMLPKHGQTNQKMRSTKF